MAKSRKQKRSRMRRSRRRGGMAPLSYSLSNGYSSKMSLGHGGDFLKYHQGQHGGQAPLSTLGGELLPRGLEQAAGIAPLSRAFDQIAGMKDQSGGRRRSKRSKRSKSKARKSRKSKARKSKSRKSKSRRSRRNWKKRGGASLSFSDFSQSGDGMILPNGLIDKAGLNPGWRGGVEFDAAQARQAL